MNLYYHLFINHKIRHLVSVGVAGLCIALFSLWLLEKGKMALLSKPINRAKESKLVQRMESFSVLRITFGPVKGGPLNGQHENVSCEMRRKSNGGTFSVQFMINPDSPAGVLSLHSDEETNWFVPAEFSITEADFSHAVLTGEIQAAVEECAKIEERTAKLELGVPYKKEQFERYRYDNKVKAWLRW